MDVEDQDSTPEQQPNHEAELESGMEVSIALAGIAAAIAAIIISFGNNIPNKNLVLFVAFFAGLLAVFSSYSSLWFLARFCLKGRPKPKHSYQEIMSLLSETELGPFWFLALGLFVWLILSFFLVFLTVYVYG